MSAQIQPGIWSKRRMAATTLAILATQILVIWLLSERPQSNALATVTRPALHLLEHNGRGVNLLTDEFTVDPTFHALPSPKSFSGSAWLRPNGVQFDLPVAGAEPRWLAPQTTAWGFDLANLLRTNSSQSQAELTLPHPPLTAVQVPETVFKPASRLRIEGQLAKRSVATMPEIPALPSVTLLPSTSIEITVNRDGNVVTAHFVEASPVAFLETRADQRRAAQAALRLARLLTFSPLPRADTQTDPFSQLETGRLVIHWQIEPPKPAL